MASNRKPQRKISQSEAWGIINNQQALIKLILATAKVRGKLSVTDLEAILTDPNGAIADLNRRLKRTTFAPEGAWRWLKSLAGHGVNHEQSGPDHERRSERTQGDPQGTDATPE